MLQLKNTDVRYGAVGIFFHWVMALLIIGMLALGLYMTSLPVGTQKFRLYGLHKEFGVMILGLVVLRISWWLFNKVPQLPYDMPLWQKLAAHGAHFALYMLMVFMPITGWLMSSASGFPVSFFGLFVMPDLIVPNEYLRVLMAQTHEWLGYAFIAVICVHVLAALQHHFIIKDDILKRILP